MAYKRKTSYKKRYTPKKRRTYRKRKTFKAKRAGNAQSRAKSVKQVMVKISGLQAIENRNIATSQGQATYCVVGTVALLNTQGGIGPQNPCTFGLYISIYRNPLTYQTMATPIANYDEMRAVGFRIKFNLPAGSTFGGNNLVSLELVWDDNSLFNPQNPSTVNMPANTTYLLCNFSANKNTFTRYYSLLPTLKKLGLGWCSTKDIPAALTGNGGFTYYGQLNVPTAPSIGYRITTVGKIDYLAVIGYMEVTWYYQFRGLNYGTAGGVNLTTGQSEEIPYPFLPELDKPYAPGSGTGL